MCNAELNVIRSFLNRCFRRNYTSISMNFWNNMIKDYFIQQISATHYIHFSLIRLRTLHCGYDKEQVNFKFYFVYIYISMYFLFIYLSSPRIKIQITLLTRYNTKSYKHKLLWAGIPQQYKPITVAP